MRIVGSPLHRGLVRGSFPAPHHHDPNETLPNFSIWSRLDDLSLWTQYALVCVYVHKGKECASVLRCVVLVFIAFSLPERLDEKVAYLDLPALNVELTVKSSPVEGVCWAS